MTTLNWTDQPRFLRDAKELTSFYANRAIHVYKLGAKYYMTTGNLFGSQTIEVGDAALLVELIGLAANAKNGTDAKLPEGCTLVPNAEKEAA